MQYSTTEKLPVAGVWSRQWEEDPLGDAAGADRTTLVLWTQTPSGLYVDLRLPLDSPGRLENASNSSIITPRPAALAGGISDVAKEALKSKASVILAQKSFAGVLEYKVGDTTESGQALKDDKELAKLQDSKFEPSLPLCTCFWKRIIDYQPPSGGLDIGVCAAEQPMNLDDGSVGLRETGNDASYAEGWYRLPQTHEGPFMALELEDDHSTRGFWVRAGSYFSYTVGRPRDVSASILSDCVGQSLEQAATTVTDGSFSSPLDLALSYVCVTGKVMENGDYMIQNSLNPELVGCLLVKGHGGDDDSSSNDGRTPCCSTLRKTGGNKVEQKILETSRTWTIVEMDEAGALHFSSLT